MGENGAHAFLKSCDQLLDIRTVSGHLAPMDEEYVPPFVQRQRWPSEIQRTRELSADPAETGKEITERARSLNWVHKKKSSVYVHGIPNRNHLNCEQLVRQG